MGIGVRNSPRSPLGFDVKRYNKLFTNLAKVHQCKEYCE